MDLRSKLNSINKPSLKKYVPGHDKTAIDFYNNFVNPMLPKCKTIRAMHKKLMAYANPEKLKKSVFPIRIFGSDKSEQKNRRGLFSKVFGLSVFYTDNSFAYFFAKMAFDNDCPNNLCTEMRKMMKAFEFPYKVTIRGSLKSESKYAAFPASTKSPNITTFYKLAHIYDVGGDKGCEYYYQGKSYSIGEICELIFPRGNHADWKKDPKAKKYVRNLTTIDPKYKDLAEKFLVAHFLRFVHPLNYFLAPKAPYEGRVWNHFTPFNGKKEKDIGEYPPLRAYAAEQFEKRYPKEYREFLNLIMLPPNCLANMKSKVGLDIDIEYDPDGLSQYSSAAKPAKQNMPKQSSGSHAGQSIKAIFINLLKGHRLSQQQIDDLRDKAYCSKNLGLSYAVLIKATDLAPDQRRFYYRPDGEIKDYLICSQWRERHLSRVDAWLKDNGLN